VNRNARKKILVINLLLFAGLFGLVSANKKLLRPRLAQVPWAGVITGCLPNFLAAFLISLAFVTAALIRKPGVARLLVYSGSLAVFGVLTLEEFWPMWGASSTFDACDILASGLGSALALLAFEWLNHRQRAPALSKNTG